MAVKQNMARWHDIFGLETSGATAAERAATSTVKFVRSQDEIGLWNPSAVGRVFTAKEALTLFGPERLMGVWEDGFAILPSDPSEPAKTLRERREMLGLTQTQLSNYVKLSVDAI